MQPLKTEELHLLQYPGHRYYIAQRTRTESLRNTADMPAQAIACRIGKLKLLELRKRASAGLGALFNLGVFHEAILENGSLPTSVLEEHLAW